MVYDAFTHRYLGGCSKDPTRVFFIFVSFHEFMSLLEIKVLFKKIHNAHVWASVHPQEKYTERWNEKLLPTLEGYYDSLDELGVPREFSMCLFCFGIDYLVAVNSWKNELPAQDIPESLIVGPPFPAIKPKQQSLEGSANFSDII